MSEEMFDVVDERDRVIGELPRSEVHARGLLHRAVHVFVFNSRGELLLQMRSATKDEYPRCWTSSASGHLSAGESYDDAGPRELEEELGLSAPLEFLTKLPASAETANEHSALYRAVTDAMPRFHPDETEGGGYFAVDEISRKLREERERFSPPFRALFEWYVRWAVDSGQ